MQLNNLPALRTFTAAVGITERFRSLKSRMDILWTVQRLFLKLC